MSRPVAGDAAQVIPSLDGIRAVSLLIGGQLSTAGVLSQLLHIGNYWMIGHREGGIAPGTSVH